MKVLFTFSGLPHYYNFVLNRLNTLENLEVHVLVPNTKSEIIGEGVFQSESGINFTVYRLSEYKAWYGREFFKGLTKLLSQINPDMIITTWPYILGFVFIPRIMIRLKTKKIGLILKEIPFNIPKRKEDINFYINKGLYSENTEPVKYSKTIYSLVKIKLLTFIRMIIFNFVDAHVNYTSYAIEILGSYGVKSNKIFVTYNSPDTDRLLNAKKELEKENIHMKQYRIIHVGRLVKWKRVDLLIESIAGLKTVFPEIELYIIGDGPEKEYLENLAKELDLCNIVKFIGSIYSPMELGKYLMSSSVYILAGMGGLSINEAMCFGKPVICSICDGTEKELVREGYNGFFFKEGDKNDLIEKIKILFTNPELTKKMGENSLNIIKDKVNIESVIQGYQKAFNFVSKK